jgi:hypothetical protein
VRRVCEHCASESLIGLSRTYIYLLNCLLTYCLLLFRAFAVMILLLATIIAVIYKQQSLPCPPSCSSRGVKSWINSWEPTRPVYKNSLTNTNKETVKRCRSYAILTDVNKEWVFESLIGFYVYTKRRRVGFILALRQNIVPVIVDTARCKLGFIRWRGRLYFGCRQLGFCIYGRDFGIPTGRAVKKEGRLTQISIESVLANIQVLFRVFVL